MKMNKLNMDMFISNYMNFVNNISNKFNYDNNIKHLLYIIIPACIIKYGIINERKILSIFENIEIIIANKQNDNYIASFNRTIIKTGNKYKIDKKVFLNKYKKISLVSLLDSLIHEFNHAINSINNELKEENETIYLRGGLSYTKYSANDLKENTPDSNLIILEETLNTIQTEEIIKIILSFKNYRIDDDEVNNLVYSLNNELDSKFMSEAYFLQTFVIRELAKNITFISTLQKMRFSGYEFNIEEWFDEITGVKGSLQELCNNLQKIEYLEKKLVTNKFLKSWTKKKIIIIFKKVQEIANLFSSNCIYK